jgi:alkylation response protein AidB-like acyl-CoA dehydrogenase
VEFAAVTTPPGTRALSGVAAMLNGIATQLLDMTVAYVKDREQFGRPVGSFQAIKHKLASMHVAISSTRPATWYAAYAIANGSSDALAASRIAKVAAASTEEMCNREALQCHGGIGFTWEHDLHLWLKRGMALRSAFGSSDIHLRALRHAVQSR